MDDDLGQHCHNAFLEVLGKQRESCSQQSARSGIEYEKKLLLFTHSASMNDVKKETHQQQCEQHR